MVAVCRVQAVSFVALVAVAMAHEMLPINPALGVPGFPDCTNPLLAEGASVEVAAKQLVCQQRGTAAQIKVGCIGDSITAGVHSSGGNHTYPGQLQIMLDAAHPGMYAVTNLGACGSTMLKVSNSPYWERPQFTTLKANTWDIIIIMLGTNDAKDPGSGGPNNWLHNCGGPNHTTLSGCTYATDYLSMVDLVKTLGNPKIFTAIPPALMQRGSIGANQTVINSVYPKLVPMINAAGDVDTTPINIFTAMGGTADWEKTFPSSCTLDTAKTFPPCAYWCDEQSCDQCHPNNDGYTTMAHAMLAGLFTPPPPPPVAPVCSATEFCCPDAKLCLTPMGVGCATNGDADCGAGQICCPFTKECVVPGKPCTPAAVCSNNEFCCPDAKHCLSPVKPGSICDPSDKNACAAPTICCPLIKECVAIGVPCTPTSNATSTV